MYRMTCDWHTHTVFSHGRGQIEDNVRAALKSGLTTIGLADHGPGHVLYGIARKDIQTMRDETERLKNIYPDMEILLGVEANIIDKSGELDISKDECGLFDYVIAGYHYGVIGKSGFHMLKSMGANYISSRLKGVFQSQEADNTDMIINAVRNNNLLMLTHPGDKGRVDVKAIAEACRDTETLFEISSWHNLDEDDLRTAALTGVKFAVSSDAHRPERVGDFGPAVDLALKVGVDISLIVNIEEVLE
jgi:putative hydrolase